MVFKKNCIPWNKGLTAKKDIRVKENCDKAHQTSNKLYAENKIKIWNKNKHWSKEMKIKLSKIRLEGITSGKIKHWSEKPELTKKIIEKIKFSNKEMYQNKKGKTYEEIYGQEKANEIHKKKIGKLSEERKGAGNPAWKDGISFEPYTLEFNKILKNQIRERDKECIICKIAEEYAKKQIDIQDIELWQKVVLKSNLENKKKIALHIHHIDYNKKNNQQSNLIALCINHHLQTNANRNKWQNILQEIMKIKLNKIKQLNLAGAR